MTATRPGGFDPLQLQQLVSMVNATEAPDLIAQMTADLCACADQIAVAAPARDWTRLREASHTLIALAGYAGAAVLQRLAETLNATAHARDSDAVDRILPEIAAELSALITVVRNWQTTRAVPW
jgi:two-component system aerobic respiration control sensor histidine kinase ArcB